MSRQSSFSDAPWAKHWKRNSEDSDDDWGDWTANAQKKNNTATSQSSDASQYRAPKRLGIELGASNVYPPQPKARPRSSQLHAASAVSVDRANADHIPVQDGFDTKYHLETLLERSMRAMSTAAAATATSAAILRRAADSQRAVSPTTAHFLRATADVVEIEAAVQRDVHKRVRALTSWPA